MTGRPLEGRLTNKLGHRQAHLLGVDGQLPLHGGNLLWAGHHRHLAGMGSLRPLWPLWSLGTVAVAVAVRALGGRGSLHRSERGVATTRDGCDGNAMNAMDWTSAQRDGSSRGQSIGRDWLVELS